MVKPLTFKGDKPKKSSKKRKLDTDDNTSFNPDTSSSKALTKSSEPGAAADAEDDDTWLSATLPSDLSGPTLIVLPTDPPTALATDSNGMVFAAELENMIEGDPQTAEPHDVRTVWVASKVPSGIGASGKKLKVSDTSATKKSTTEDAAAGLNNEGAVELNFKSCYGQWLSVTEKGELRAQSLAVGRAETFKIFGLNITTGLDGDTSIPVDGQFAIQTAAPSSSSSYITTVTKSSTITVRGDGSAPTASSSSSTTSSPSTLLLRMQTRFHPSYIARAAQKKDDKDKISRSELEKQVGRKLTDEEVKKLKRAYRKGELREEMLTMRVKGGRDKFA